MCHSGRLLRGVAVPTTVDSPGHSLGVASPKPARLRSIYALVVFVNHGLVVICISLDGRARAVRSRVVFLFDSYHALS